MNNNNNKNKEQINMSTTTKQLTEAFLRWPLPKSVRSDECATIRQEGRTGTNLMTYVEAEKMFTDIVGPTLAENSALKQKLRAAESEITLLREERNDLETDCRKLAGMISNTARKGSQS